MRTTPQHSDSDKLTVFYDGACPLCEREIAFYQRRKGADAVDWVDVSTHGDGEVVPGLSHEQAMARFHVVDRDGKLASGGQAFAQLWMTLPGFAWIGKIVQVQPLAWILERAYRAFLVFRPGLQRLIARRTQ